jgi:hypothetical protein
MTRSSSKRRSLLTLAIGGILVTAVGCDSMESDQRKADNKVKASVDKGKDIRRAGTTQSLTAALAEFNKAAGETAASPTSKIRAKSIQAQTEFESGERLVRDLSVLSPTISRLVWDISQTTSQVEKFNDNAKALAATNPDAPLAAIATKRTEMVAAGEAAGKKAAELQGGIDKIKGEVDALIKQKDAALAEADASADQASKATGKAAADLLDKAGEGRRKSGNLGHDIDKLSATLLPLERDLAVEQGKKKNADEAVAALDASKKAFEENWQAMQAKMAEQKAQVAKLGEELTAKAKELDDANKQAAALRQKAVEQFKASATHYSGASSDAKGLATELGQWSNGEKFREAPEKKAWDQLKLIYNQNIFKLLEAEADNARADALNAKGADLAAQQQLVASIKPTLAGAGITLPASLEAAGGGEAKTAMDEAGKAYTEAAEKFLGVYEAGGTPKDVQQAARISRMFSLYGQYLNGGEKAKLDVAKEAYKAVGFDKEDPMLKYLPADLRA